MVSKSLLMAKAKLALRITTNAFDDQVEDLITSAQADLGIAGVIVPNEFDALVSQAIVTYCRMHFGQPDDYDRLKRSYDEQKAQLVTATGYTNWLGADHGQV